MPDDTKFCVDCLHYRPGWRERVFGTRKGSGDCLRFPVTDVLNGEVSYLDAAFRRGVPSYGPFFSSPGLGSAAACYGGQAFEPKERNDA